jgi:hypothetical protein
MIHSEGEHAGPTGSGTVVLELGPGMGALVLITPPELDGAEIDISVAGIGGYQTHSIVRRRHVAGGTQYAAVYPSLPPGSYTVWRAPGDPLKTANITGGTVTITDWTSGVTGPKWMA